MGETSEPEEQRSAQRERWLHRALLVCVQNTVMDLLRYSEVRNALPLILARKTKECLTWETSRKWTAEMITKR